MAELLAVPPQRRLVYRLCRASVVVLDGGVLDGLGNRHRAIAQSCHLARLEYTRDRAVKVYIP